MLQLNWNILWNVVNILALFLLLKLFLFKPVTKIIDERRKAIADELDGAQAKQREADGLKQQYEAHLADARKEAAKIVQQAREQASREGDAILAQARSDAGKLLEDARRQAAAESEKAMAGVRGQVAGLALLAASRLAQKNMDRESDLAFVDSFLAEVGVEK